MSLRSLAMMVGGLVSSCWMPVALAAEHGEKLYHVTCPPRYPGPEKQGTKLTHQRGWYDTHAPFGRPETIDFSDSDTSILIDCGYGYPVGQPGREELTPYRVIVAVPGHVRRCGGPNDGRSPYWCETAPEEDGTIGPVKLYISERISLSTTLKGFGLGWSLEEILVRAGVLGFACVEQGEASGDVASVCTGEAGESVTIRLTDGRSRVVEWHRPGDQTRRRQLHAETVLRFGTELWMSYGPAQVSTWMERGGKAKLELAAPWDSFNMVLTDLTVPAPR